MAEIKRIAIAEDDIEMAQFVADIAIAAGHRVIVFTTGEALLKQLPRDTFDLLILDWVLPDTSGFDVLRWAHANMSRPPATIMLSSRAEKVDVAACLLAGADDYIIKPEAASVIAARIMAVLRRTDPANKEQRFVEFGAYCFDRLTNSVAVNDDAIGLTAKEFALALMFFQSQNKPISRAYILETLWNSVADLPTRTLDMHVSRIRSKLSLHPENGFRISTIFGYGYRLEAYDDGAAV